MEDFGLSTRSEKELLALLDRSEIDLVWLSQMEQVTKDKTAQHYKNQYYKELKYQENIKLYLEKIRSSKNF